MKKVTYIISDIDRAASFEWIAEGIDRQQFDLSFILLLRGPSYFETYLRKHNIEVYTFHCRGKKDWPVAFLQVYKLLKKLRPDIIHTHFYEANLIGLPAGKLANIPRRIYTRHYSTQHHTYFKKGVLFDKFFSRMATQVIAISDLVKDVLINWENLPPRKIAFIPHGIKIGDFEEVPDERVTAFRERHKIGNQAYIVGVISRLEELKGVQYIVPAFRKFLVDNPEACLLVLNARGVYRGKIESLLEGIPQRNYRLIEFERDIAAAYKVFHVFVHVPINAHCEAFGLVYVEALAAGTPSIFTLSGIAPTFIRDEKNALVVPFQNAEAIYQAIHKVAGDMQLAERLVKNGLSDVKAYFQFKDNLRKLEALYADRVKEWDQKFSSEVNRVSLPK